MHNRRPSPSLKQHGFTYTEVMLSAVLLAVLVVPALQALQSGVNGGATSAMVARRPALSAKMEEVLSHPFPDLYSETYKLGGDLVPSTWVNNNLSDAAGADRRVVVIYRYDALAKVSSINDTGLMYVRVYYEAEAPGLAPDALAAIALNTLAGRWW